MERHERRALKRLKMLKRLKTCSYNSPYISMILCLLLNRWKSTRHKQQKSVQCPLALSCPKSQQHARNLVEEIRHLSIAEPQNEWHGSCGIGIPDEEKSRCQAQVLHNKCVRKCSLNNLNLKFQCTRKVLRLQVIPSQVFRSFDPEALGLAGSFESEPVPGQVQAC